jgi:hypothetical protein
MYSHILVEWDPDNSHTSSSDVSNKRDGSKCRCSVNLIGVDNILIKLVRTWMEREMERLTW